MKAEDYDWEIYHIIAAEQGCREEKISEHSGFSPEIIQDSLCRLVSHSLIESRDSIYRVCSIDQFMIANHVKHDPGSQIYIENGVVKVKNQDHTADTKARESGNKP